MATAFEQLKQKQATTDNSNLSAFDRLKQKQTSIRTETTKEPGFFSKLGSTLVSAEKGLGEDIGYLITGGKKNVDKITKLYTDSAKTMTDLANKQTDPTLKQKYAKQAVDILKEGQQAGAELTRTPEQMVGDVLGTALDVGTTLSGIGAVKAIGTAGKTLSTGQKVVKGIKTGAKLGAAYGATGALQENKDIAGVASSALVGGLMGGATGGVLEGGAGLISSSFQKQAEKYSAKNITDLAGRIVQGKTKDKKKAAEVLYNIGINEIKSGEDLENVLNKKIESLANAQNEIAVKNTTPLANKDLKLQVKVGEKAKNFSYVKEGLNQLKSFYNSVNDKVGKERITQVIDKLNKQGLTLKEVNQIAIEHGEKLKGFNASGQLASGLTKQASENTRKGIKSIFRQNLEGLGKKSEEIDKALSKTLRVKTLVQKRNESVSALQQKLKERNIFQKLTANGVKIFNTILGGTPKAAIEALGVSNVGNKIDNFMDLERTLLQDLKEIQKLMKMSDEQIAKKINSLKTVGSITEATGKISNLATQKLTGEAIND